MKFSAIFALCIAVVVALPVSAQSRSKKKSRSSKAAVTAPAATDAVAASEEKEAKSGVRFIACSVGDGKLPSTLYYKDGKEYKSVRISTRRPSVRMKASGGSVDFWDKNPAEEEKEGKDEPKPALSIDVPSGSKMLGIIIPGKDLKKSKTMFLNEKDFPKKGVHIINLSPYTLKIALSEKGDYTDKKESLIGPYRGSGITDENSWKYKGEKDEEQMSFLLQYKKPDTNAYVNIKSSRFAVSSEQSQINIVVKDPEKNRVKLLSTQLAD